MGMMKLGFSAFLFLFTWVFFLLSLEFEFFTSSGKPGPGLFPITIGLLLLIFTGIRVMNDWRNRRSEEGSEGYAGDIGWVILLTFLLVLLMTYIGAVPAMALYIYFILFRFNRKRYVQNAVISITIPALVFAMFELWLNAGLPKGILGFM
ncbi:tripartite tricarboxylate transporter family receptor [Paenibacillus naphthalenovorans]|uniref:Tripartite tricarboxylate transporter family receptor n=2 Tax=Paenibacillus naphthalenovorans TaxID=162209 RepID=A0A0U2W6L9_9BACL|nr:tripartite tricarboxylate transporter family receptor [Paenibacillus naphthalenovorans]